MFTLLTEPSSGFFKYLFKAKHIIKACFWVHLYGPNSVLQSILEWFKDLEETHFNINPKEKDIEKIVFIPLWVESLRYAIWLKNRGLIRKIIAWPNISIPVKNNDIFFHPSIDTIIVPSQWVQDYFYSLIPHDRRIVVIPAGVETATISRKNEGIILYIKKCPPSLISDVREKLQTQWILYKEFIYGNFQKSEYLEALKFTKWIVYLQESESQWIALHEAWMHDVPTLVWNRGYWKYRDMIWHDMHISAPYLTDQCGIFFEEKNFSERLSLFLSNLSVYSPREYSLKNFTNAYIAKKILQQITGEDPK